MLNLHVKSPHSPPIHGRSALAMRLSRILDSRMYSNGDICRELEAQICAMLNIKQAVLTCNGTMALMIAMQALDVPRESAVYVPSWTFPATAQAVTWTGRHAIYVDAPIGEPGDRDVLDMGEVQAQIPVRLWGSPVCQMLNDIASQPLGKVIIDSAHAFGSKCSDGEYVGHSGHCEVFSFHANKVYNTFEGGCIVTNSDELAMRCRKLIEFGNPGYAVMAQQGWENSSWVWNGINGKMPEICAAMGLVMLPELQKIIRRNWDSYGFYVRRFDQAGIKYIKHPPGSNCAYIVIETDFRNEVQAALREIGVHSQRYFYPGCHRLPIRGAFMEYPLPNTERLAETTLVLPHVENQDQADTIVKCIEETVAAHRQ